VIARKIAVIAETMAAIKVAVAVEENKIAFNF
jgi:hypothetical protein